MVYNVGWEQVGSTMLCAGIDLYSTSTRVVNIYAETLLGTRVHDIVVNNNNNNIVATRLLTVLKT